MRQYKPTTLAFVVAMDHGDDGQYITLQSLSRDGEILGLHTNLFSIYSYSEGWQDQFKSCPPSLIFGHLRKLAKAMEKYMPESSTIREEQEMLPGGDIRVKGNSWLRKAWTKSKASRVPREAEFRRVVRHLANRHSLCFSVLFHTISHCVLFW